VAQPKPRAGGNLKAPKGKLDARKTYRVTMTTNCGSFTITLDVRHSPHVAASFVSLVRAHYFDRTVFHRIVPGFVIQGGDPTVSGSGGPGYSTHDKVPANARYTLGVVAMAKTQAEPAGTSGSQFFVVTAPDIGLPPDYALLGKVTKGLAVIRTIGRLGDPATEKPTVVVEILKATVAVS
jgi:cyclophilin family peptidyl-prolyl cis-trans isomerase